MPKRRANKRAIATVALAALVVGGLAATAVAQSQRFPDVPPTHEAYEAVEWAAEVGLTVGREDGTFGPNEALPKWRALIFMERFYDDVLGAEESGAFTSGDMMVLLKAINDGAALVTDEPVPETAGTWLPRGDNGRVASGRCAHLLTDDDVYEWEDCAWGRTRNPVMGRDAAEALSERVWGETLAQGKPDDPPEFTEGDCSGWFTAACYIPDRHTISIGSDATKQTILHELAHALISGDDTMIQCMDDWAPAVQACGHDVLFRCAADALYQRYADIDPAGVCGAAPDFGAWTQRTVENIDGVHRIWSTVSDEFGVGGTVSLNILCAAGGQRVVYFNGTLAYSWRSNAPAKAAWRIGEQTTEAIVTVSDGEPFQPYGNLWELPDDRADSLLASLSTADRIFVRLSDQGGTEAEATLRTTGYRSTMAACSP